MSEFPTGTYKKAHRHSAGAEIVIMNGTGYSLLWYEGGEQVKVDWHEGTVFSPRDTEYHQHFNTGPDRARYLAIYNRMVVHNTREMRGADVSEAEGGWQIEDEDPAIYDLFERECARHGSQFVLPRLARA